MRPIEVFYHLYIPADQRHGMWTWWVDEQLSLLEQSKLTSLAKVNMAITMPVYWQIVHCDGNFQSVVTNYINHRYPFVNIVDVRDVGEPNIYEGQTLRFLYQACHTRDVDVLYFHSKGLTSMTPAVSCWRQILNHYCIGQWQSCVKLLDHADVVGVRDAVCLDHMVSGNFWWAKSSYIRTLPEPLNSTKYQTRPSFYPGGVDYRYSFEDWLWSGIPKVSHIVDTKVDHFRQVCLLENIGV